MGLQSAIRRHSRIQVLDRAIQIISILSDQPEGLSAKAVALQTKLTKSTARRILMSLEAGGFCERTPTKGYRLGLKLFEVGMKARGRLDLREQGLVHMRQLATTAQETVQLFVRNVDRAVCIERVDGGASSAILLPVGGSLPLHIGGAGPVLLAHLSEEEQQRYVQDHSPLEGYTRWSLTDSAQLLNTLRKCREQGWIIAEQAASDDIIAIAAPIRDFDGHVVAAISIAAFHTRFNGSRRQETLRAVLTSAHQIARALGYRVMSRDVV